MKKIIAAIAICLVTASAFASCSDPLSSSNKTESNTSSTAQASQDEAKKSKVNKSYADSFKDLRTYMKDKNYLTDDAVKNANSTKINIKGIDYKYGYELIGAVKGEKYTVGSVVLELYEFKEGEKNDTVESVKKNGTFTLYEKEITAYLTDNNKYMMIYTDKNIKEGETDSDAYKTMQKAIKAFKAFKPTKK